MSRMGARVLLASLLVVVLAGGGAAVGPAAGATGNPIQVYGAWHCSNDACDWATVRDMTEFDRANHWLIDRTGNGGAPSVNLVVLSFVNPLKLLDGTNDAGTLNGVPKGMTKDIVSYFTAAGIEVMVSIGGITYTKDWNTALAKNATLLGQKAAALASQLGVGIEIDYEEANSPNLSGLQDYVMAYRAVHPYDASGSDPTARLTIDLAAGDRWLIGIARKATADWLQLSAPVLDFANAMVPSKQPTASGATSNWQEHVDGKPRYAPPIPPLAPSMFTGSLYLTESSRARPECNDFAHSLQNATAAYVQTVASKAGGTPGMLGFMFWAAEKPSTRGVTTAPPNSCENGMGVAASTFGIPFPLARLRDH